MTISNKTTTTRNRARQLPAAADRLALELSIRTTSSPSRLFPRGQGAVRGSKSHARARVAHERDWRIPGRSRLRALALSEGLGTIRSVAHLVGWGGGRGAKLRLLTPRWKRISIEGDTPSIDHHDTAGGIIESPCYRILVMAVSLDRSR